MSALLNPAVSVGDILGDRYQILRELGHGGFSRTYLALDRSQAREYCVLKEFAPQLQSAGAMKKARELFIREAGVLEELKHPQIPRFRDLLQWENKGPLKLFLVQDYVEGQTYRQYLNIRRREGRYFTEFEIIQWLKQLLPVLDYIHTNGVIHRDISPDNLILRRQDHLPVLIDFGGVKPIAAQAAQAIENWDAPGAIATQLGKIGYAPDEQIMRGLVFPHSDLYALAATALVLMTGKEPQQWIDPVSLQWTWQDQLSISPGLTRLLAKMLAKQPSDRFLSARQVSQALSSLRHYPAPESIGPALPFTPAPQPSSTPRSGTIREGRQVSPRATPHSPPWWRHWCQNEQPFNHIGKSVLTLGVSVSAAVCGWTLGQYWIAQYWIAEFNDPNPWGNPSTFAGARLGSEQSFPGTSQAALSPNTEAQDAFEDPISEQEWLRKSQLRSRRLNLHLNADFFNALTQAYFLQQYPSQRGRTLTAHPQDQLWRERWDGVAERMLSRLSDLSPEARQQLGNYEQMDREQWKQEVNQLRLSSRALYDLAEADFFSRFPEQKQQPALDEPMGQVWSAIIFDQLQALQQGETYESLPFVQEERQQRITGQLGPGQGKTFVAHLSGGQWLKFQLDADQAYQMSIYTPTGQTTLLEDSTQPRWSGYLEEDGYYEFVIVSKAVQPLHYHLNLALMNSSTQAHGQLRSNSQRGVRPSRER